MLPAIVFIHTLLLERKIIRRGETCQAGIGVVGGSALLLNKGTGDFVGSREVRKGNTKQKPFALMLEK